MAKIRQVSTVGGSISSGFTRYCAWGMANSSSTLTESDIQNTIRVAGVIANLRAYLSANTLSSTYTIRTRINTANGNQAIVVTAGATGASEDNTHTDAVAVNDVVNHMLDLAAGGTAATLDLLGSDWTPTVNTSTIYAATQGGGRSFSADSTDNFIGLTHGINTGDTEANRRTKFQAPGTFQSLTARTLTNSRATTTALRSRINGADGNQVVSITAAATGLSTDSTHTDAVVAGDLVCMVLRTSTGGGAIVVSVASMIFVSTASQSYYAGGGQWTNGIGLTHYNALSGVDGTTTVEANRASKLSVPVTLSNLAVVNATNAATGPSTVRLRINAADGNQGITISAAATGYSEDNTHTDVSSTAADTVDLQFINGGGGTIQYQSHAVLATYSTTYPQTITDGGVVGDAAVAAFTFGQSAADDAGLTDAAAIAAIISPDVNIDGAQLLDLAAVALALQFSAADGVIFGDAALLVLASPSATRSARHSFRWGLGLRL